MFPILLDFKPGNGRSSEDHFQEKKVFSHQDVLTNKSHTQGAHTHTQKRLTQHDTTAKLLLLSSYHHTHQISQEEEKNNNIVECGREKVLPADPTCEAAAFYMNFRRKKKPPHFYHITLTLSYLQLSPSTITLDSCRVGLKY